MRRIQIAIASTTDKLVEYFVMHRQKPAIAIIETLALNHQLIQLHPHTTESITTPPGEKTEQLLHGLSASTHFECDKYFASPLGTSTDPTNQTSNLGIEKIDLIAVTTEELLIKLLHQGAQTQIIVTIVLGILLNYI